MRHLKHYAVFWISLVILFNLVCFITPNEWYGISKYSGGFWSGYGFITASFIIHFVYAYFIFDEKNRGKRALNMQLTIISFVELGLMIAIGLFCMIIPSLPYWVGIILCYIVLAFSVVFLLSAKVVGENSYDANVSLNIKTSLMRELADKAQGLVSASKTEEIRSMVLKVYETIKYSDTVSSLETQTDEMEISDKLSGLEGMLQGTPDEERFRQKVEELMLLIEKRNNKCKALKRRV